VTEYFFLICFALVLKHAYSVGYVEQYITVVCTCPSSSRLITKQYNAYICCRNDWLWRFL